jgi:hypothetical protein
MPQRGPDANVEAARVLARYVTPGSSVAIHTLAPIRFDGTVYEPAGLELACLQGDYGFDVGYLWDINDYDSGIARLRQVGFKYVLLDSFPETGPRSRIPYFHFTAGLLQRAQAGGSDTPGLRVIARFQIGGRDQTLFRILPLAPNQAADVSGSRAIATDQQEGYPVSNLNDGTAAAWGSVEGDNDVYAAVVLPSPTAINEVRLMLFSPAGRPHLRNIRIVTADGEGANGPVWQFVRARLKGSDVFASVITVPPLPDNSIVTIELDHQDPHWRARPIWGFACLRSQGDLPNYLTAGRGVYVRELEIQ